MNQQVTTYIVKANIYYKIGRTVDLKSRYRNYELFNPISELILTIPFDCELYLHDTFKDKQFKGEWFILADEDLEWIRKNINLLQSNKRGFYISEALQKENILKKQKTIQDDVKLEAFIKQNPDQFKH